MSWVQLGQEVYGKVINDWFGSSVSLNTTGKRFASGARFGDGSGNPINDQRGYVSIYDLSENTWVQVGEDIVGEAANDWSGWASYLSDDGKRVAIGAVFNDGSGNLLPDSGHVRVYEYNETSWVQLGQDIDGENANDWSGWSVALNSNGSRVAIGAHLNDGSGNLLQDSGQVRVYEYNGTSWVKLGSNIYGLYANDESGYSVSLNNDGSIVAIGARASSSSLQRGSATMYQYNGSDWTQLGQRIDGEQEEIFQNGIYIQDGELFGYSISLNYEGNRVAIGGPYYKDIIRNAGVVRVYEYNNGVWNKIGENIVGETQPNANYAGWSVSLDNSGNTVAIGAPFNAANNASNSLTGSARIYRYFNDSWQLMGSEIDGIDRDDRFGQSISISSDGNIVAISSATNDANTGILSDNRGSVRVFQFFQLMPNLNNFPNIVKTYGDAPFIITDPSTISDGPFVYTSSNTNIADISGNSVIIKSSGLATITAKQLENVNYLEETITTIITVERANPIITNFSIPIKNFGDKPFQIIEPSSNSTGYFTYNSSNTNVADISGNIIIIKGIGSTNIIARQEETSDYLEGTIDASFIVNKGLPTITNFSIEQKRYDDEPFNIIDPSSNSDGSFNYISLNESVATISGKTVTILNPGTTTIRVTQSATENYLEGVSETIFYSDICFPAGTPIKCDQGNIDIEKINTEIHTIDNKKIIGITKIICHDKFLVCFEKDSLGKNIPSQKTVMTRNHKVMYNGKMIKAEGLLRLDNVYKVKYNGQILYNVLLENYDTMKINNIICETLHPENDIAKLYKICKSLSKEKQAKLAEWYKLEFQKKNVIRKKSVIK
jgi:hypothetical protein